MVISQVTTPGSYSPFTIDHSLLSDRSIHTDLTGTREEQCDKTEHEQSCVLTFAENVAIVCFQERNCHRNDGWNRRQPRSKAKYDENRAKELCKYREGKGRRNANAHEVDELTFVFSKVDQLIITVWQ